MGGGTQSRRGPTGSRLRGRTRREGTQIFFFFFFLKIRVLVWQGVRGKVSADNITHRLRRPTLAEGRGNGNHDRYYYLEEPDHDDDDDDGQSPPEDRDGDDILFFKGTKTQYYTPSSFRFIFLFYHSQLFTRSWTTREISRFIEIPDFYLIPTIYLKVLKHLFFIFIQTITYVRCEAIFHFIHHKCVALIHFLT